MSFPATDNPLLGANTTEGGPRKGPVTTQSTVVLASVGGGFLLFAGLIVM